VRVNDPTVPAGYAPTAVLPPRRRRGRTFAFVAGLALLGCCVAGVTASVVGDALRQGQAGSTAPPLPGIGEAVRDGQFEFVVTSVECGHSQLASGILRAQAQGQFCVVELRVTNVGREGRHFGDGLQKAFGPDGAQYTADTNAGVVVNGDGSAIWNVINPGNRVDAAVVFDVPSAATITTVELHDSALSGGVRVSLAAA
jgi:hypothetical protein